MNSLDKLLKRIPGIVWISFYLVLVTDGLSLLFAGWAYDDPFITYRYAENLSRGLGLVYNRGESVLSTTTPLFTLLLAALRPLWSDLPSLAILTSAFSLAVGGIFLWDLMDSPGLKFARWTGLLFYPIFPLVANTLSSETPLYLALCLGAFASYRRQHLRRAALSASLAALTRPDGLLIGLILGIHYIWSNPPSPRQWEKWFTSLPWQAVLIYLGIGLPWVIYAWMTYGSPIPVTLFAKQQQATIAGSQSFLPGFLTIVSWYSAWFYQAQVLLALPGLVFGLWRSSALRLIAAWTMVYFLAYAFFGVTRYFWYYAPLVPLYVVAFGSGLDWLANLFQKVLWNTHRTTIADTMLRAAAHLIPALFLTAFLLFQIGKLWNMHFSPDPRYPIYRAVGDWLRENSPSEASVGTLEVGIIGYYAQRTMVDFSGLIQPDIAAQFGQAGSYNAVAQWAVRQYKPEYLVLQQGLFTEIETGTLSQCQQQVTLPGEAYGYTYDMGIFFCPSQNE
jgi:hypothetical protein